MAFEPRGNVEFGYPSARSALTQASAASFMSRVYGWMVGGLALTGAVAAYVASNEAVFNTVAPYMRVLMFGQLGVVLLLSFLAHRMPGPLAALLFVGYAIGNGVLFSVLFYVYATGSIASAFFITAASFGALSVYGTVTKRDLSAWSTFLFMGLIGIVIAGIVNIFVASSMLSFVVSCAAVLVFAGLTAYDTQKLRTMHASSGYSSALSLSITGALVLYLDFINLFLNILRLMGRRR